MLRHSLVIGVSCLLLCLCVFGQAAAQVKPVVDPRWLEPQAKGPVHEAFAQPFEAQPLPGPMVPNKPPDALPETPPDMAPPGADVQWIPGYWAWDSDKGEFLWVTGTYRHAPPGRQYVPGYWIESGNGWRWVEGYWAPSGPAQPDTGAQGQPESSLLPNPQYTPQPPAPLQTGPVLPGPDDAIYNPGYWSYQNGSFAWRPGFYYQGAPQRMWIPPHYVWTPRGYVFVSGYWDYPLEDRGVLFAPVAVAGPRWSDPNWSFTPSYTVNTGLLLDNLFCSGPFFWYGNYYAGRGYRPWFTGNSPYLGYYAWLQRGNPGWQAGLQRNYAARAAGTLAVPARAALLGPLHGVANLNRLSPAQVNAHRTAAVKSRALTQQRLQNEARPAHVNAGNVAKVPHVQAAKPAVKAAPAARVNTPAAGTGQNRPAVKTQAAAPAHTPATARHSAAPAHVAPTPARHAAPAHHAPAANHRPAAASHGRAPAHHGSGHKH